MTFNKKIKKGILYFLFYILILMSLLAIASFIFFKKPIFKHKQPDPWMTIFVHGTFGSMLGFLNFQDVLQDKVSGTNYRKLIKKMRDDPFFFKDQPMLQRGLIYVEPTFDLQAHQKKFVAYPLAQAYETITQTVIPGQEKNYFYTFGWSGLMSQSSRRFESIRFYNALSEEIEKLKQRDINPKIRLIGFSHGGNLCLNLAAVKKSLKFLTWDESKAFTTDADENEALKAMAAALKKHTTKEIAKTKTDQKIYDYVPTNQDLVIEELIMYGTPIQPETECFVISNAFKNVYNFYSMGDLVQRMDWITSKKPLSSQRISHFPALKKETPANGQKTHIVQVRLMAEKPIVNGKIKINDTNIPKEKINEENNTEKSIVGILTGRKFLVRESKDPTHKELWFSSWRDETSPFSSFLSPLPVVILTPLFIHALKQVPYVVDADMNINPIEDHIQVYVAHYQDAIIQGMVQMQRAILNNLQEKIKPWKPEDISHAAEFDAAYKHLQ